MSREHPQLTVVADADALAKAAADRLLKRIDQTSGRLAVCLTGGSTPERLYELMATERFNKALPWDRIHWFWGDDRFVPQNDRRSNAGMARRLVLDRVPAPPSNIHAMPTSAGNVEEAARSYERELGRFSGADRLDPERPLFAMVLMGLGADGHTASLFPGHAKLDGEGTVGRWGCRGRP
jgi:6-phosphogluconolactonase